MVRANEIGGYIEFEHFYGDLPHKKALRLNCGRACLAYLIEARRIKSIWLPDYLCSSVLDLCVRENVKVRVYSIGRNFEPSWDFRISENEYLYIVDYYGQLSNDCVEKAFSHAQGRLIIDEAQNFFAEPRCGIDTIYTARKFFGVPDGAFLSTNAHLDRKIPVDESFDRMRFLLGRFEKTASEFYPENKANNKRFSTEPIKIMSALTENIMRSLDYERIKFLRNENYAFLAKTLDPINELKLCPVDAPFAYPLLIKDGAMIRNRLALEKIYVPTLWPCMTIGKNDDGVAGRYARDILPLPVDQRYTLLDMQAIIDALLERNR